MPTKPIEASRINRNGLPRGASAPEFRLRTADGDELTLSGFRGTRVLLVFSDPDCGPCTALAPELERLHRSPANELRVLMVSRGDAETNLAKIQELDLTFPVVLQRGWNTSREYGMFATPIAYLVDEEGVIAADVAVGIDPILTLASVGDTDPIQSRLAVLREELEKGRVETEALENYRTYLHDTMLRLSGAIQVLEELSDPVTSVSDAVSLDRRASSNQGETA